VDAPEDETVGGGEDGVGDKLPECMKGDLTKNDLSMEKYGSYGSTTNISDIYQTTTEPVQSANDDVYLNGGHVTERKS